MPDKIYVHGCGNHCLRCWRNRLKHANPQAKAYLKRFPTAKGFDQAVCQDGSQKCDLPLPIVQMRKIARDSQKKWHFSVTQNEKEQLEILAHINRRKRLQRNIDSQALRPNRRIRKQLERLTKLEMDDDHLEKS